MKIDYQFERCIICQKNPCDSWEHVIPNLIGGRLQAQILCRECNNSLGTKLISQVKQDPYFIFAVDALKDRLPGLYKKFRNKAIFSGKAEDGSIVKTSLRENTLQILPSEGINGSRIINTDSAALGLYRKLVRQGYTEEDANKWKERFLNLDEGIPFEIPSGEVMIKHVTPPMKPEIGSSFIDTKLFSLIAYEYLSLMIGDNIYKDLFIPVRLWIQKSTPTDLISFRQFHSEKEYRSFHRIRIKSDTNSIKFEMCFFGWMIYTIDFLDIKNNIADSVYIEDLETPQSLFAPTFKAALSGEWLVLP